PQRSRIACPVKRSRGSSESDNWNLLAGSKYVVIDVNRFRKPALEHVRVGQKIIGIWISRIERESGGEITFGLGKMVAASVDVAGDEVRISLNRFIKRLQRLEQCRPHVCRINITIDDRLGLKIKFERDQILRGTLFDFRLLLRRKFRFQLSHDRLRQVTLDCE